MAWRWEVTQGVACLLWSLARAFASCVHLLDISGA